MHSLLVSWKNGSSLYRYFTAPLSARLSDTLFIPRVMTHDYIHHLHKDNRELVERRHTCTNKTWQRRMGGGRHLPLSQPGRRLGKNKKRATPSGKNLHTTNYMRELLRRI